MLLSFVYFAVRRLLRLLTAGRDRDKVAREVEILVLRHQLQVLSRGRRLRLGRWDRMLLAAASRLLPRERWRSFPVSPRPYFAGTAISQGASGPTDASDDWGGRESQRRWRRLSSDWREITRAGATRGSRAN